MNEPNHYAVLGLPPQATQAEIGRAYRALLRLHHPDTRSDGGASQGERSDAALQEVFRAYAVLGDPARRTDYDREAKLLSRRALPAVSRIAWPAQPPIVAGPVHWSP
ncbi:J domain-containing protein [Occultella kanbiaonis]|uniref:J domain-containing protein n=1 Tax=Occultella kanbiaonis TaxID=2675754 RepID=UPI0012B93A16|nr:J domain-containing protein [Occultella kanbiaonis]